jgi:L-alanine-DL-glutamate epimerase-like enolase superfamily enzyme
MSIPRITEPVEPRRHSGDPRPESGGSRVSRPPARALLDGFDVSVYRVAPDDKSAEAAFAPDPTTVLVVEARAASEVGVGYGFTHPCAASHVEQVLAPALIGADAFDVALAHDRMLRVARAIGDLGVMGVAAVDIALWDLKARLLGVSLIDLIGAHRSRAPVCGSPESYAAQHMASQLVGFVKSGFARIRTHLTGDLAEDVRRVSAARAAIGDGVRLTVDADGAYSERSALSLAERVAEFDVACLEDPVASEDFEGLRFVRERCPRTLAIAAGKWGTGVSYFRRLLEPRATDAVRLDATRCLGISGFLKVAALAAARGVRASLVRAPAVHAHLCCAAETADYAEYAPEEARVESLLFDGVLEPKDGYLEPDRTRPGLGLAVRRVEARHHLAGTARIRATPTLVPTPTRSGGAEPEP